MAAVHSLLRALGMHLGEDPVVEVGQYRGRYS